MLDATAKAYWVSPSQIATYRLCPRKWGWDKLNGIKAPPNAFAEKGNRVHAVGASWSEDGTEIDLNTEEGKIFAPGVKYLPPPGVGLVEQTFRFRTSIASYIGIWDLLVPTSVDGELLSPTMLPQVYDHKTTSDFKWMKHAAELMEDVQSNIYAIAALAASRAFFEQFEIAPRAQLNWIYYRANEKRPGARHVQLYVLPDGHAIPDRPKGVARENFGVLYESVLMKNFAGIEQTAQEMLDHRRAKRKAMDLDINVTGCNAYGGCFYRGTPCKLTTSQVIRGHMDQQQSLAEKMKKSQEAKKAGAAASTGDQPVSLVGRMKRRAKPAEADASAEVVSGAEEAVAQAAQEVGASGEAEAGPAVNPGEAETQDKAAATLQAAEEVREAGGVPAAEQLGIEAIDRVGAAALVAQGVVSGRLYQHTDGKYTTNVGKLALGVVDKIIELASK
jgi:hypothetical protein